MSTPIRQRIQNLVDWGFDLTEYDRGRRQVRVKCSQCCVTVLMGTPCHERGCRHEMKGCDGCGNIVARNVRYCEDCQ